ncbi:Nonribosomal siderophore peptide synthase SidC [Lasiodiplodia theobromae]|uniref:Nonribosomal siderophore peptide synthase SidC n=1 Tax=Lasiodiplodia theobromae TaxID=45133 RepID=UPI0015C3474E|nr:Nonribosomal siderophore peptide synthase SidC [Lasiodiplodia theobromae]KAF4535021.1 Nonribosomal siderophore peptide synthase SidC [Lasiodiplodia theobromae]
MQSNDSLPIPAAVGGTYAGQLEQSYILPSTKVPALHPFHADEQNHGSIQRLSLRGVEASGKRDVADDVRKYANAVMAFTGLDDIAFGLVISEWKGVVHAVAEEGPLSTSVKVFGLNSVTDDQVSAHTDFVLYINPAKQWRDERAKFVLELSPDGESNSVSYDTQLIPEPAVASIVHAFESFMLGLQDEASDDSKQLLSITNFPPLSTPSQIPQDRDETFSVLLHSDFERRAAETPDQPALDFLHGGHHTILSYAELDAAANTLAAQILEQLGQPRKQQEGRPDILPFYLPPSPELYVSYLGVLKSGYGFCPLPLDAPEERLRDILDDLAPRAVLGSGAPETRPNALHPLAWIDVTQVTQSHSHPDKPPVQINPADVAYVMYTSGSTGKPKGVQIQHHACTCSIRSHAATLPLSTNPDKPSRWFQFAASTFDPSIMEIFVTWSSGATLCSADRQLTLSDLEGTVTALRATVMMTTPSVAALLRPAKLPTLRSLWTMGEALTRKVIENFAVVVPTTPSAANDDEHDGPTGLANAYGPTEASINCTLFPVPRGFRGSVIGPALPTSSLFVLDPSSTTPRPVPAGFAGELAIGGPQLSKGYLNRPAETAAAFVDSREYGRLYRTGDRARLVWGEDGNEVFVEFLGRISAGQVKLNGRRAELGEIEGVLAEVPGVKDVAVGVAKHGSKVVEACREQARKRLPDFMRPAYVEVVAELPRLPSAKIDRKRVAAIAQEVVEDAAAQAPVVVQRPAGSLGGAGAELFTLVQGLIADAVGTDAAHVQAEANLFSLGLDSLRSMALLQRLREKLDVPVSVAEILQCRTAAGVAALLAEKQADASPSTAVLLDERQHEEVEAVYPPTATQSGMLASFVRSLSKDAPCRTYINHSVFEIQEDADLDRLKLAWESILTRHEAFRTVFVPVDDDMAPFAQCILAPHSSKAQVTWEVGDVPDTSSQHINDALRRIESDISLEDPPYKLTLLTSPTQRVIIVSLFHAIFDGGSFQLLLDEVDAEYRGETAPHRTSLRKAVDMHHLADHDQHGLFWSRYLEGLSPLPFPNLTGLRPEARTGLPQTHQIESTVPLTQLRDAAKAMGTSALAVLQAAWLVVLSGYTGSADNVVFGSVISGRFDKDLEVCMAPTFATIPVRTPVTEMESITFLDVARKLAQANAESLGHLQARIGSITSASGQLPYDTLFAFQEFGVAGEESSIWKSINYPPMANDFAVMIEVWPSSQGAITLKATFTDAHLNQQGADVMLTELNDILQHILSHPDQPFVSGLSAPRVSLLSTHPASEAELRKVADDTSLLHSQLESHARTNPDATALVFVTALDPTTEQITWTYAELNQRASAFAAQLRARFGDLRGVYVPLCLEKSPALYVALLGILKAGGAWCPVDPFFPARRRHDLILRTQAPMVVVDAGKPELADGIPRGVRKIEVNNLGQWTDPPALPGLTAEDAAATSLLQASPDDPAYLIWTSGTTGQPKGVPIHHRAAVASMTSLQRCVPSNADGKQVRCMQFSQFTFDVFVQDLFYTWGLGGAVVSSTRDNLLHSFAALATATRATHAHLTPAFAAGVPRKSCPTLRVVTFIGEKLPQHVADDWGAGGNDDGGDSSSSSSIIAFNTLTAAQRAVAASNVGVALPTLGTHVVHPRDPDRVVLRGAVGELALSGPQLAKGYLDTPAKTAAAFVWSAGLGCAVYRTGDELGGIRVELSEIEWALRGCEERAAEVARKTLEMARLELPEHMIPGVFLVVREIPRTRSAKAWEELLNPSAVASEVAPSPSAGRSEAELFVMRKIQDLTGAKVEAMNRASKLAALGVDSIGALRLAARLKADGYSVSVADMMASSTVQGLVTLVEKASSKSQEKTAGDRLQQFHSKWAPKLQEKGVLGRFQNAESYWSNHAFELKASIEPTEVLEAWAQVVRNNDILRTSFFPTAEFDDLLPDDSAPSFLQVIHDDTHVDSQQISIAPGTFLDAAKQRASAIAADRQQTGFRSPLCAITIFDDGTTSTLMLTLHHAIHDGPAMHLTPFISAQNPQPTLDFWKKELDVFAGGDARTFPDLSGRRNTAADTKPQFLDCVIDLTESVASLLELSRAIGAGSAVSATFSDRVIDPALADAVGPLISVVPAAVVDESVKHRHVHPRTVKRLVNCQPSQPLYCAMFAYHPEDVGQEEGESPVWRQLDEFIPLTVEHPIALNVEQKGGKLQCTFSALDSVMNRDQLELFARQVDALSLLSVAEPEVTDAIVKAPELPPTHWLDHWANEHPDWVALEIARDISEDGVTSQSWTYKDMVALCMGRSFIAYATVAAIWKSGNCYLPVAEDLPLERQALLLRDSGSAMLFTDKASMSSLPAVSADCRVVLVDDEDFESSLPQPLTTSPASHPDDNSYLLYTSGSSGTPKGVLVSRGNLSAFTEAQSDFICREVPSTPLLGGTGKYLAHASRAFDVHICEMVLAWRHGLAVVTAPTRAALLDDLRLALAGLEAKHVPKLRYLGVGGEKISQRIIDEFAASDAISLVNAYGPTEATIGISSINYVKRGQAGELCVTGDLVANGYHQRPDAKGFVEFDDGQRMYRTGDMAKVRGQRLELEEVSAAVANRAGMKPAKADAAPPVFVVEEYREWAPRIVAGWKADVRKLRAIYEAIPRAQLVGGKGAAQAGSVAVDTPAQRQLNAVETRVRDVLRTVVPFELGEISPATNIFDLGIDSLNAIDLSIKLRKAGFTCSVADVLSRPLLSQLAEIPSNVQETQAVVAQDHSESRKKLLALDAAFRAQNTNPKLPNAAIQAVRPCLPLQESLVASSLNDDTKSLYVNHIVLKLAPSIDIERLRDAWLDALADVDILRTCFEQLDGTIVQVVLKPRAVALPWDNISHGPLSKKQKEISADIIDNIQVLPPYRLATTEGLLLISIHHSLYDAVSMNLILSSVYAHYQGLSPQQQGDMEALYTYLLQHDLKEAESFWKQYLQDFRPSYVSSKPRSEGQQLRIVEMALSNKLSALSKQASRAMATLTSLLEAVLGLILAQSVGTDDVTIGRVLAGRAIPVPSADTLIAPLVTTIPSRIRCDSQSVATVQDVIAAVHNNSTASLAHQHTPLRHIQRWAGCATPLFDVLYSFSRASSEETLAYANAWTEQEGSGGMAADYPLAIEVVADSSSDVVTLRAASTDVFGDEGKTRTLLENIDLLVQASAAADGLKIADLHIHGAARTIDSAASENQWDEDTWSPQAQVMRSAVAQLCGLAEHEVTKNASFFSLGLDSVTAIRFSKALKAAGLRVSSADIMKHMSIGALENHLTLATQPNEKKQPVEAHQVPLPIPADVPKDDVLDVFPCTPLQTSMITQTLSSGSGKLYVHHHAAALPSTIDVARLKDAWTQVVQSTDILRTSFHAAQSSRQFIGVVHEAAQPNWSEVEAAESIARAIDDIVAAAVFPAEADFRTPPLRATLITSGEQKVLVVTLHHALYDGHSVPLIFADLAAAYHSQSIGSRPSFSAAARAIATAQQTDNSYWSRRLAGYRKAALRDRPGAITDKLHTLDLALAPAAQDILAARAALGITLQTAALLAFGKALATQLTGVRDVVFGHVLAGRDVEGVEDADAVVGPLFNTVPFRLRLEGLLATNGAVAGEIQREQAEGRSGQHEGLGEVTKAWRKATGETSERLFDALFVFTKTAPPPSEGDEEELFRPWKPADGEKEFVPDDADYPLNFEFEQGPSQLVVRASCRDRHLDRAGLQAFVAIFEAALEDVLTRPDRAAVAFPPGLKDLPVAAAERVEKLEDGFEDMVPGPDLDAVRDGLAEVTQVPREEVELASNVYALGLDSIAAIQVVAFCRERGVVVSVTDILQGGTLGGIVRTLRQKNKKQKKAAAAAAVDPSSSPAKPKELVSRAVRFAAIDLLAVDPAAVDGRTLFEPTWAFVARSPVDPERLKDAWWRLRQRHAILRTCFAAVAGENVVQVALKPEAVKRDYGFRQLDAGQGEFVPAVVEEVKAIAARPSDLFTPPVRLCLLRSAEKRDAVLLTFNHATYDAWTIPLLLADLAALYASKDVLAPPPAFADFITHALSTTANDQAAAAAVQQHWQNYLHLASPTILGSSSSSSSSNNTSTSSLPRQTFVLIPSAIRSLTTLDQRCRQSGVALHATLLLAIARVLARHTNALSGPTLNLLPLVVRDALGVDARSGARAVQEDLGGRLEFEQRSPAAGGEKEGLEGVGLQLEPLRIGVPTDFAPKEKVVGRTAVDGIDGGWLRRENNLFVDVGRNEKTDAIDVGVRYEGDGLAEAEIEGLVREVAEELGRLVGAL